MKVVRTTIVTQVERQKKVELLTYPDFVEWREEAADNCVDPGKSARRR